jgi:NAD(P)-dependent dehydrogenase (short-subunit alcohol dehydrogenase family)
MRFSAQIAIITGARQGIGYAIAERLGSEGAKLFMVSRDQRIEEAVGVLKKKGIVAQAFCADVGNPDGAKTMVETCLAQFERIDILINNAGVVGIGPIETISPQDWEAVLRNNLTTAFLCSQAAYTVMRQQRSGSVVNVSSIAGRSYSLVAGVHYTASKAALIGFTRQFALEAAPHGIRVNAIAPSQTDTPMLRNGLAQSKKTIDDIAKKIPLGRIAQPDEVASVCAFLCSQDASYVTGAVVDINGGLF